MEEEMKTMWDEDPTELVGLEDEGGFELSGSDDDDEEEPTEFMGLGEDEGEEGDESFDLSGFDDEEEPMEMSWGEDEDEEENVEEAPESGQRPGLHGLALAGRARRKA